MMIIVMVIIIVIIIFSMIINHNSPFDVHFSVPLCHRWNTQTEPGPHWFLYFQNSESFKHKYAIIKIIQILQYSNYSIIYTMHDSRTHSFNNRVSIAMIIIIKVIIMIIIIIKIMIMMNIFTLASLLHSHLRTWARLLVFSWQTLIII